MAGKEIQSITLGKLSADESRRIIHHLYRKPELEVSSVLGYRVVDNEEQIITATYVPFLDDCMGIHRNLAAAFNNLQSCDTNIIRRRDSISVSRDPQTPSGER